MAVADFDVVAWEADPTTLDLLSLEGGAAGWLGGAVGAPPSPQRLIERLHPADREAFVATCREVVSDGVARQCDCRVVAADGHEAWVDTRLKLLPPPTPRLAGLMIDVTSRQRAEAQRRRDAEASFAESTRRLRATIEASADGLLVVSGSGQILDFNQRFVDLWKIPHAVIAARDDGRAIAFVLDQLVDPTAFLDKVRALYGDPSSASYDTLHFKDGRIFERDSAPLPLGEQGCGRVWSFRDVSERWRAERALQQSQQRYQALVDSLDGIVWESRVDSNRFTFVSPQAERMLGYPVTQWTDEASFWTDKMHPEDRAWAPAFCANATRDMRSHDFEYRMIAADGRVVWLRDICSVVTENGAPVLLRGIMIDTSELRRLAGEREQLLGRERELRQAAEEAVHARDEFISTASHELRTPVTALRLAMQSFLLLSGHGRTPTAVEPAALTRICLATDRQLRRLAKLVDSLLDVTRIQAGQLLLDRREIDLATLAGEVIEDMDEELRDAGCELRLEAPAPVRGRWDAVRLEQVLVNLLSNALKYGAGKPIRVAVRGEDEVGCLIVEDEGIGIPVEAQARIFERFERAVAPRDYTGLGLGLYVVQKIVAAHDGRVRVDSAPGHGSRFTVELPH